MTAGFWRGKRVLLTGHTGFKGAWCAALLADRGAEVSGFSLPAEKDVLWHAVGRQCRIDSRLGDIRDEAALTDAVSACNPQIVLHMAAQALVRESYRRPFETFETNVIGTGRLLEALRPCAELQTVLVVTSDKVYRNTEDGRAFCEDDPLGGHDPYSASKAACEMLVSGYGSAFAERGIPLATVRGGNVIGGGDWSHERLVPDIARALKAGRPVALRNPGHSRPWQHVLDCLDGYLAFMEALAERRVAFGTLNIGPVEDRGASVAEVADAIGRRLPGNQGWAHVAGDALPEKSTLGLDVSRATDTLGWRPRLTLEETLDWTAEWYAREAAGEDAWTMTREQIQRYHDLPHPLQR